MSQEIRYADSGRGPDRVRGAGPGPAGHRVHVRLGQPRRPDLDGAPDRAVPPAVLVLQAAATHPSRAVAVVTINSYARLARAPDYPWGLPPTAQATAMGAIE